MYVVGKIFFFLTFRTKSYAQQDCIYLVKNTIKKKL